MLALQSEERLDSSHKMRSTRTSFLFGPMKYEMFGDVEWQLSFKTDWVTS